MLCMALLFNKHTDGKNAMRNPGKTMDAPHPILVSVWNQSIDLLNRSCIAAYLRRDEFLNRVLAHEAKMLAREVRTPNSDAAKAHIASELKKLELKKVNLRLKTDTVIAIQEACTAVNIPRDTFVNRVLLLLVAKRSAFEKLLPAIDWRWATGRLLDDYWNYFEPSLQGAIAAMQDITHSDPFRFYRACIELTNREIGGKTEGDETPVPLLHSAYITKDFLTGPRAPKSLIGLNCSIPDWKLPNTDAGYVAESLEDVL